MSAMANTTPLVTSVTKPTTNPRDVDATPRVNIQEFCEEYYEDILPIIMEKFVATDEKMSILGHQRQSTFDRLSETYSPSTTKSRPQGTDSRDHPWGRSRPHKLDTYSEDRPKYRERFRSIRESYDDSFSHTYCDENRSFHMKKRRDKESPLYSGSKSNSSNGRYQRSRLKRHKSTDEDDLTRPWMCEKEDPFTPRIHNFECSQRTRMPNKVKTYDETGDPEDHVKISKRQHRLMNEVNNPKLTKRLNEHVPNTMEEMMITITAFIRGEAAAASKKKGHALWKARDQSKRKNLDKRSSMEILYKHYSNWLWPEIKRQMVLVTTSLTGFSGETIWSLGQLRLLVIIGDADNSKRAWMNFMIVRTVLIPTECTLVITSSMVSKDERTRPDKFKVALHSDFPDQKLAIKGTLSDKRRTELCSILKKNLNIFSWKPSYMTRVSQSVAEHRLNIREGYSPVRQKKKGYHQIQLAEPDEEKTTFHTGQGVYCYIKMPFGLKNAGATYQRLMDKAFESQIEGVFLGYVVTPDGIKPCLDKTAAILQLPSPRTIKEGPELNYTPMEKLVLSLVFTAKRLRRYFQAYPITFITDQPIKQIMSRLDVAGGLQKWSIMLETQQELWTLFTDGSSCVDGSGSELILTNPEGIKFTYALRFQFAASNNEAEYEVLITRTYVAKEDNMVKYLDKVRSLVRGFTNFSISQVPRSKNKKADALSKIASTSFAHLSKQVLVEVLKDKSIKEKEVTTMVEEDGPTWMTPIVEYLKEGTLPSDMKEARKLCIKARQYELMEGIRYRWSFLTPWLICVGPLQAEYVIREIHEGSCSMHAGPWSVVAKAIRLGYYWPTTHQDARDMIRKCNDCQVHRLITRSPQQPLTLITALWPFYKWEINIAGPFLEGPGKVKFFIVAMDYFTKWIEAKTVATITVSQVKKFVWDNIVCRFGLPEIGMPTYRTTRVNVVSNDEELRLNLDLLEEQHGHAAICKAKAKSKMINYYNVRVRGVIFRPGDFVYYSNDASHAVAGGKLGQK
nr:reverse transcriptase domain-containing protein [Tanacetum cinerariifolium]